MKKYISGLALVAFLTYLNSFGNGFVWDDLNNIIQNNALKGPWGLREVFLNSAAQIFYRPVPYLTIWLDWNLFKDNPFGYHFTNFAFHLACVILVFFLCQRLTQSPKVSFVSALIFAVHPVHTEAVAYISGRSDVICGFFIFLSFYFYLDFLNSADKRKILYLCGALFSFLLALFSKEIALIFPLVILFYPALSTVKGSCTTRKGGASKKILVISNILFAGLAIAYLLFRYLFVKLQPLHLTVGKWYLFPKIFLFYLRLLVFPFGLHMQHSLKEADFLLQMPLFLSALIFLGVIFAAVKFIKDRYLYLGLAWFIFWMLPFLGFLKFNSDIAEHWLYISSLGFFLITAKFISQSNLLKNKFVFSFIILFFCLSSIQRNSVWRDDISIYRDTLRYNPDDSKLHYNLGNAYLRRGLLEEAASRYLLSLKRRPNYAYALNNLGLVKERQKDLKSAYQLYKKAFSLDHLEAAKRNLLRLNLCALAFAEEEYFDHSLYAELLNKFVKDGRVNYTGLKSEPYLLDSYFKRVAKLDPQAFDSLPRDEKLALYINAYNAFTLKVITDHYPLKSIRNIPGVWDKFKVEIAGRKLSLNQIEHEILRKGFKEPRIHFALVCASKGCPKLADEPFNGKNLNEQLEKGSKRFFNDKNKVWFDKDSRTLNISSIFKWFKEDFGDVMKFVTKYLPNEDSRFIQKEKPSIKYLKYDWSLNE